MPQSVVLAPTRELCMQIYLEARKLTCRTTFKSVAVYGGAAAAFAWDVTKDWIELFIRNENILSPDSEISRNFHNFKEFLPFFRNVFLQFSTIFDIFAHICEIPRKSHQDLEVK